MVRFISLFVCIYIAFTSTINAQNSLEALTQNRSPQTVEELWKGYDPSKESLEITRVRQWKEDGIVLESVVYTVGTFKGVKSRVAAIFGYPENHQGKIPGLVQLHGGGQRAESRVVKLYAKRGYAVVSVNWGGRDLQEAKPNDPKTNWGAIDPTQNNVAGYSNLLPSDKTIDSVESPRNNNWYAITIAARRAITFLEQQSIVDATRIGVFGHSMGGRLTCLVAGSDSRVKAASPSVGGSGYLQYHLWGLPGSARRVKGDLNLFRNTIAGQSHLKKVKCPILFLSATNDFNAPMDFVSRGMSDVPAQEKQMVFAPHLNHRFTPETEIARPLWFDAHLLHKLKFPQAPRIQLILDGEDRIPVVRIRPDTSKEIDRVEIYYGYERDPRNRFWADPIEVEKQNGYWVAQCPVLDLEEPLFVFANVYYLLKESEKFPGDPDLFALSCFVAAYPHQLKQAGIKATAQKEKMIDDFSRGMRDWYQLSMGNRHHWLYSTRKLADPRWEAPQDAQLELKLKTEVKLNHLGVRIQTNSWRGYAGKRQNTYYAIYPLREQADHTIMMNLTDFKDVAGKSLPDWHGITELIIQPGARTLSEAKKNQAKLFNQFEVNQWNGIPANLTQLRWVGGTEITREKPFINKSKSNFGGLEDSEFQKAIDSSVELEKQDALDEK